MALAVGIAPRKIERGGRGLAVLTPGPNTHGVTQCDGFCGSIAESQAEKHSWASQDKGME